MLGACLLLPWWLCFSQEQILFVFTGQASSMDLRLDGVLWYFWLYQAYLHESRKIHPSFPLGRIWGRLLLLIAKSLLSWWFWMYLLLPASQSSTLLLVLVDFLRLSRYGILSLQVLLNSTLGITPNPHKSFLSHGQLEFWLWGSTSK